MDCLTFRKHALTFTTLWSSLADNKLMICSTQGGAVGGGGGGVQMYNPFWANYFKIMQFLTPNSLYTPNFCPQIGIFLAFAPFFSE